MECSITEWKTPYDYQLNLFQKAKDKNAIITLPTGRGKTYIASLIIYDYLQRVDCLEKFVVFLCPNRVLAQQQSERLESDFHRIPPEFGKIEVNVKLLTSESSRIDGLDEDNDLFLSVLRDWECAEEWNDHRHLVNETAKKMKLLKEDMSSRDTTNEKMDGENEEGEEEMASLETPKTYRVFVMTPEKFIGYLVRGFILLPEVGLLAFDECHNARLDHPYRVIMRDFYGVEIPASETCPDTSNRPQILGLTASPLGYQSSSRIWEDNEPIERAIKELQSTFNASLFSDESLTTPIRGTEIYFSENFTAQNWKKHLHLFIWQPILKIIHHEIPLPSNYPGWRTVKQIASQTRPRTVTASVLADLDYRIDLLQKLNLAFPDLTQNEEGYITEIVWRYCFSQGVDGLSKHLELIWQIRDELHICDGTVKRKLLEQWNRQKEKCAFLNSELGMFSLSFYIPYRQKIGPNTPVADGYQSSKKILNLLYRKLDDLFVGMWKSFIQMTHLDGNLEKLWMRQLLPHQELALASPKILQLEIELWRGLCSFVKDQTDKKVAEEWLSETLGVYEKPLTNFGATQSESLKPEEDSGSDYAEHLVVEPDESQSEEDSVCNDLETSSKKLQKLKCLICGKNVVVEVERHELLKIKRQRIIELHQRSGCRDFVDRDGEKERESSISIAKELETPTKQLLGNLCIFRCDECGKKIFFELLPGEGSKRRRMRAETLERHKRSDHVDFVWKEPSLILEREKSEGDSSRTCAKDHEEAINSRIRTEGYIKLERQLSTRHESKHGITIDRTSGKTLELKKTPNSWKQYKEPEEWSKEVDKRFTTKDMLRERRSSSQLSSVVLEALNYGRRKSFEGKVIDTNGCYGVQKSNIVELRNCSELLDYSIKKQHHAPEVVNKSELKCLVFCEQRLLAMLLHRYAEKRKIPNTDWMTSTRTDAGRCTMTVEQQRSKKEKFAEDDVSKEHQKILFCTSVLSEGIDIRACNKVIRFDRVKNVIDNIQARGRLRQDPARDDFMAYIVMTPTYVYGSEECTVLSRFEEQEDLIYEHIRSGLFSNLPQPVSFRFTPFPSQLPFSKVTGAFITATTAQSVLHNTIAMLASSKKEEELREELSVLDSVEGDKKVIEWISEVRTLPALRGHRVDPVVISFNDDFEGGESGRKLRCLEILNEFKAKGILDENFSVPVENVAKQIRIAFQKKFRRKGNNEEELWREIAYFLRPSKRYVYSCNDVYIKGSVHYDPSVGRNQRRSKLHKLKEALLFYSDTENDSKGAGCGHGHNTTNLNDVHRLVATPEEVNKDATLYLHRVYYNVESSHSEILASGGLFGLWRAFYRKPSEETIELIEALNDFDSTEENTDELECINLPPVSSDGIHESIQKKVQELSGSPSRVLQPLCILLERPLPFTIKFMACHDSLGEAVGVEIEPMRDEDDFGKVVLSPLQVELLAKFRKEIMTLIAVTNLNIDAVSEELRDANECIANAGARLVNLVPPFFLTCPLWDDGKSLDFQFVIDNLRLNVLTISGIVREEKYKGRWSPPSLQQLYAHTSSRPFIEKLFNVLPSKYKTQSESTFNNQGSVSVLTASDLMREFLLTRQSSHNLWIPYWNNYIQTFSENALPELLEKKRNSSCALKKNDSYEMFAKEISQFHRRRGLEPPVCRMVHENLKQFRFYGLRSLDLTESPHSMRLIEQKKTLFDFYKEKYKKEPTDMDSFIVIGESIRQGPKSIFIDTVKKVKNGSIHIYHAPDFVNILPLTDAIFQQVGWLPAMFFKIDIISKHFELRNSIEARLTTLHNIISDIKINNNGLCCMYEKALRSQDITDLLKRLSNRIYISRVLLHRALTARAARLEKDEIELKPKWFRKRFEPWKKQFSTTNNMYQDENKRWKETIKEFNSRLDDDPKKAATIDWDSERLEFLGDAVLKLEAGIWAFFSNPDANEKELNDKSDEIKTNEYLYRCCRNEKIQNYLWAAIFVPRSNGRRNGMVTLADLRRQNVSRKMQSDIMESLLGAVYLSNYHDSRLFPTLTDTNIPLTDIFGDFKPLKSASRRIPRECFPQETLCAVDNEELGEAMAKHCITSDLFPGCKRIVGSNSGLFACALFCDAYLNQETKNEGGEVGLRSPVSPLFEVMRRISLHKISNNRIINLFCDVALSIPHAEPTTDPNPWVLKESIKHSIMEYDTITVDRVLKNIIDTPPIIDEEWLEKTKSSWPTCNVFLTNKVVSDIWMFPCRQRFQFKDLKIITMARTDTSAGCFCSDLRGNSYERLEFLGDSILSLLLTEWLYLSYPEFREGPIAQAKSILQGNNYLARKMVRRSMTYNQYYSRNLDAAGLLIGNLPSSIDAIKELVELLASRNPDDDFQECWEETVESKRTGEKKKKADVNNSTTANMNPPSFYTNKCKRIADLYESFIAATFIDSGFDLKVVWCCIAVDFEPAEERIRKLLNNPIFRMSLNKY